MASLCKSKSVACPKRWWFSQAWCDLHHEGKEDSDANHDAISYPLTQNEHSILVGHIGKKTPRGMNFFYERGICGVTFAHTKKAPG